jgi:hypothetical protein
LAELVDGGLRGRVGEGDPKRARIAKFMVEERVKECL